MSKTIKENAKAKAVAERMVEELKREREEFQTKGANSEKTDNVPPERIRMTLKDLVREVTKAAKALVRKRIMSDNSKNMDRTRNT